MNKSLAVFATFLVLLSASRGLAAESFDSPVSPSHSAGAALQPARSANGSGPRRADPDSLSPTCGVIGGPPSPYEFPRLALGTNWVGDWLKKPEGMAFLYQFMEIYGPSTAEDVLTIKQRARAENHGDWADHTIWIQDECLVTTGDWSTVPPEWAFGLARNNVPNAINMAVYMNRQLGVDWFLRDIHGEKMPIWGDTFFALNLTPDCPVGAWDGTFTYQGRQYSLGDTRGLTFVQWLQGPFAQTVIRGSLFAQVFNGLMSEDYPSAWLYYHTGQVPDPRRDGVGFPSYVQFEAYCRPVWRSWFLDFLKPLQDQFIIQINNHNTRWSFDDTANPWPEIQEAANGCKLERYFGNGGWPMYDRPMWNRVYEAVERLYHPLSAAPDTRGFDGRQGWDVTIVQLNASSLWPSEDIDRYKRAGLASTLMGDGVFDGTAADDDYFYSLYLRRGQTQYAPREIPEMHIRLGKALGPASQYVVDPAHPLDYRRFFDAATNRVYTVVSNVWSVPVAGIPAQDGAWFLGIWPAGEFETLTGGFNKGHIGSVPEGAGLAEGGRGAGSSTLRAIPSVTRTTSVLGLPVPTSSPLDLTVVGVDGRMVRALVLAGGRQSVTWDGCDTTGRRVPPGQYFVRAGDRAGGPAARVTVVR
jgi:hypothetical protein